MHNALLITEVFGRIIYHLREDSLVHRGVDAKDSRRMASRRALTVLARTCQAFSEPALDALWQRLDSLQPFLLCLITRDKVTVGGASPAFDNKEWSIVSRYTPRVQELRIKEHNQHDLEVLQLLWFRGTLPILPRLRKLVWCHKEIASIRLFLGHSLLHLYVDLREGDGTFVMGFLECYHILCPNLKSLSLEHTGDLSRVTTAVSCAVSRSLNLQAVFCKYIDEGALMHISNSRRLTGLIATLHMHKPDNLRRLVTAHCHPGHSPFENLRTLELHIQDLSSIIPFLVPQKQPFEVVSLEFDVAPTAGVLHEFFVALRSTTRQKTLRQIKLVSLGTREKETTLHAVDYQALSLLMNFNLHVLDVDLVNPVKLKDDELVRLAQAWPDLEIFSFNQEKGWNHQITFIPTLRGLLLVAKHCPKLRDLGLCVDARNVPLLSEDESLIRNMTITSLSLADSPIQESVVDGVAEFLRQHFPALGSVDTLECNVWEMVSESIQEAINRETEGESESEDEFEIERIDNGYY